MKKKSLLLLIIIVVTLFTVGCSTKKSQSVESNNENILIVGFDASFPPMGFKDDNGEYSGFDIELAKKVANKLDMDIKLQPIDWASKDAELNSGNINAIWNGFTKNGRENDYTFSDSYMKNRQVVVVNKNSDIVTLKDLEEKKLELQDGSTAAEALEKSEKFKKSLGDIKKVPENLTALNDLGQGSTDAVLMDEVVARYNIKKGREFKVLNESISDEEYAVGFKLGNDELKDKVNRALKELSQDGVLKELSEKWMGEDITLIK